MNEERHVLIVDDDPSILEVLDARLCAAGFVVHGAGDGPAALRILKSRQIDILVSDMKMPEMSGMELLTQARASHPRLPIIFLTAYGTIPDAVHAVQAGAVDYLTKPFDGRELVKKIQTILARSQYPQQEPDKGGFIWGKSPAMLELHGLLQKVAVSNANVLILGESGVGKECIAKLLHNFSGRQDTPYIVVDCGFNKRLYLVKRFTIKLHSGQL